MSIGVFEIETPSLSSCINLGVIWIEWTATEGYFILLDSAQDSVEFLVTDVKCVVVAFEVVAVVKVQSEGFVYLYWGEMPRRTLIGKAKDMGEELG